MNARAATAAVLALAARPLIPVSLALVAGVALGTDSWWFVAFSLVVSSIAFTLSYKKWGYPALLLFVICFAFCGGFLRQSAYLVQQSQIDKDLSGFIGGKTGIVAAVSELPERGKKTTHLILDTRRCCKKKRDCRDCSGKVIVFVSEAGGQWQAGDVVELDVTLRKPRKSGNPGEFDYAEYLKRRGIVASAYLRKPTSVKVIGRDGKAGLLAAVDNLRGDTADWIEESINDKKTAAVLKALTLGIRKGVDDEIRETFAGCGTAHLLAISGMHLGVVALLLYLLLVKFAGLFPRILRSVTSAQFAAAGTLLPLWGFALLAGLRVSTMRAAIMASVYLFGRLLRRPADGLNSLALAAILVLMLYPFSVYEPAFQLSFLCVAAIIIGVPALRDFFGLRFNAFISGHAVINRFASYLFFIWASSLLAFLATAPVVMTHFHSLSWLGLLANILVVPVFTLALIPISVAAVFLHILGLPFDYELLRLAGAIFVPVYDVQKIALEYLGGAWHLPAPGALASGLYYLGLLYLARPWRPRNPWSAMHDKPGAFSRVGVVCLSIALLSYSFTVFGGPDSSRGMSIVVAHSRSGTVNAVFLPDGKTELLGTAWRSPEFGQTAKRLIAPLLFEKGSKTIDSLWLLQSRMEKGYIQRELERFVGVVDVRYLWKTKGKKSSGAQLIYLEGRRGKVPALLYNDGEKAALIVGQPHIVKPQSWHKLKKKLKEIPLALIWHGPGKIETLRQAVSDLRPDVFVLAMDRRLGRYISRENWLEAQSVYPEILRSDRDGAIEIGASSKGAWQVVKLRESSSSELAIH